MTLPPTLLPLDRLIASVEETIESMNGGRKMEKGRMFGSFDDVKMEEYRKEGKARWGRTVDESYARLGKLNPDQQAGVWAESEEITQGIADRMDRDAGDTEVQELVGRWHGLINERFWSCSPEAFRGLGEMYVQDSRFTEFYDRFRPGLAAFLRDAMNVYCDRTAEG